MKTKKILSILSFLIITLIAIKYIDLKCVIHTLTGLYCPGCGSTRAIKAILSFDIYQAFRYNIAVVTFMPSFILYTIIYLFKEPEIKKFNEKYKYLLYITIIVLLCFGILRNIKGFEYLQPTKIR